MDKYQFGNRLTELRTQKGLTQDKLGEILGVSNKAVSKWENGSAMPRLDMMVRIADYFEIGIDEFFDGNNNGSSSAEQNKLFGSFYDSKIKEFEQDNKGMFVSSIVLSIAIIVFRFALSFVKSDSELLSVTKKDWVIYILFSTLGVALSFLFRWASERIDIKRIIICSAGTFTFSLFLLIFGQLGKFFYPESDGRTAFFTSCSGVIFIIVNAILTVRLFAALKRGYIGKPNLKYTTIVPSGCGIAFAFLCKLAYFPIMILCAFLFLNILCLIKEREWLDLFENKKDEKEKNKSKFSDAIFWIIVLAVCLAVGVFGPTLLVRITYRSLPNYIKRMPSEYTYYDCSFADDEYSTTVIGKAKISIPKEFKVYESDSENGKLFSIDGNEPDEKDKARINIFYDTNEEFKSDLLKFSELFDREYEGDFNTVFDMERFTHTYDFRNVKFGEWGKAIGAFALLMVGRYGIPEYDKAMEYKYANKEGYIYTMPHPDEKNHIVYFIEVDNDNDESVLISLIDNPQDDEYDFETFCKMLNSVEFN